MVAIVCLLCLSLMGCGQQAVIGKGIQDPTYQKEMNKHREENRMEKIREIEGVEDSTLIQYNGEYHG